MDRNVSKYVNTGDAKGLVMLYNAIDLSSAIQLDFTIGVGAQMFSQIESLLDTTTGAVETEIDTLTDTNELSESRIEEMLVRLEIQQKDLLDRFIRMEVALATAQRILDSIRQTTEALFSKRRPSAPPVSTAMILLATLALPSLEPQALPSMLAVAVDPTTAAFVVGT